MAKCKNCKQEYKKYQPLQTVCGYECSIELSKARMETKKAKAWAKEKSKRKEALKTNSDYVRELQAIFNMYIRLRDKHKGCISCGKSLLGKYDAGHYYSTGSYPELRFNEDNVHGQCVHCNQHKRGNLLEYRERLKDRIPTDRFVTLNMLKNTPRKYTIEELKELKEVYKQKIKEFEIKH